MKEFRILRIENGVTMTASFGGRTFKSAVTRAAKIKEGHPGSTTAIEVLGVNGWETPVESIPVLSEKSIDSIANIISEQLSLRDRLVALGHPDGKRLAKEAIMLTDALGILRYDLEARIKER